jgi:hypothetical protein
MVDRADLPQPAPRGGRLLVRLCLLALCGGLLLLLSSGPAEAAGRREAGLLDPVGTTLKATAREVDSLAGRAAGSGVSPVTKAAAAASRVVAPRPRPAAGPARSVTSTVKRGAPAVTSPVRRVAPPTRPATSPVRRVAEAAAAPVARVARVAGGPVGRATEVAGGPVARVAETAGPVLRPVGSVLAPVSPVLIPVGSALTPVGSALAPVGSVLAPVGTVLAPVGSALAPVVGPVAGLVAPVVPGGLLPLPRPAGAATGAAAGPEVRVSAAAFAPLGAAAPTRSFTPQTYPARPAADGASSPAARSIRSWPALTDAVSLPGVPASAELPAGGPDPLSNPTGAGLGLAALAAALLLLGLRSRGGARPEGSGAISRSYLPLVSPA